MKEILKRALSGSGLINRFTEVSRREVEVGLLNSWKEATIPQTQYDDCTKVELERYRKGLPVQPYDILVSILKDNVHDLNNKTLLEIGCSSGYYSEVLRIQGISAAYHGCDYSEPFIRFAKRLYPAAEFQVQDACRMTYSDNSFDIVISGCCLLHIMDYENAIKESVRVAREYVVFHRTPVLHKKETSYYIKKAYGVKMFEIHFNERELLSLMKMNNLKVIDIITFDARFEKSAGDLYAYKTYLCSKG